MRAHEQDCKKRQKALPKEFRYKKSKNADVLDGKNGGAKSLKAGAGAGEDGVAFFVKMAEQEGAVLNLDEDGRIPCRICSRKFSQDRIEKHEGICYLNSQKKGRKTFMTPAENRIKGTEFEAYKDHRAPPPPKKSRWRLEVARLRAVVEQGKQIVECVRKGLPLSCTFQLFQPRC